MIRLKSYSKITKQERVDDRSFSGMIFSSVLGIVLCMICLAGLTWAWFSDSASSSVNTLSAARFDVSVAVTNTTTQVEEQPQSEKQFALSNGTYAVTLTGTGNAQTYGGYCTLILGSDTYHTCSCVPENSLPLRSPLPLHKRYPLRFCRNGVLMRAVPKRR